MSGVYIEGGQRGICLCDTEGKKVCECVFV